MSHSINRLRRQDYAHKYEMKLLDFAEREVMFDRFMLGERMNKTEALHTIIMAEVFCVNDCATENAINKKIDLTLTKYSSCREDVKLAFNKGCKNCN